jgi:hypothetical protein
MLAVQPYKRPKLFIYRKNSRIDIKYY